MRFSAGSDVKRVSSSRSQIPHPDVAIGSQDIERNFVSVGRQARIVVLPRRRRDRFFKSLTIHPHQLSVLGRAGDIRKRSFVREGEIVVSNIRDQRDGVAQNFERVDVEGHRVHRPPSGIHEVSAHKASAAPSLERKNAPHAGPQVEGRDCPLARSFQCHGDQGPPAPGQDFGPAQHLPTRLIPRRDQLWCTAARRYAEHARTHGEEDGVIGPPAGAQESRSNRGDENSRSAVNRDLHQRCWMVTPRICSVQKPQPLSVW